MDFIQSPSSFSSFLKIYVDNTGKYFGYISPNLRRDQLVFSLSTSSPEDGSIAFHIVTSSYWDFFFFFLNNDGKLIIEEKEFVFHKPIDKFMDIAKFAQIW